MQPESKIEQPQKTRMTPDRDGPRSAGIAEVEVANGLILPAGGARITPFPDRSVSPSPQNLLYRPNIPLNQLLISIIQDTQPSLLSPPGTAGQAQGGATDPLLDALQRLGGHGILPSRDAPIASTRERRFPRGPTSRASAENEAIGFNAAGDFAPSGASTSGTRQTERSPDSAGTRHAREQPRQEPLSEERVRQILEKALAAFHERRGDLPTPIESPATTIPLPERPIVDKHIERGVELRQKEPVAEVKLPPSVRDTLNDPRNDTARLMQQLLTGDLYQGRQSAAPSAGASNTDRSVSHQVEPTLVSIRAGINEGLSQIRDALQTTIERSSPRPPSPTQGEAISAQATKPGDFTQIEPVRHHQAPTVTVQREDRTAPRLAHELNPPSLRPIVPEEISMALSSAGALRPVGEQSPKHAPPALDTGTSLLDAIARAAEKAVSLQTLRTIDQAVETAVISAAAAVALGVIGGDIVLKEILALGKDILERLRPRTDQKEKHEKEMKEIRDLVEELERICSDRDVETIDQPAGFVADITGTIRHHDTDLPLEGIEVDGGSLGITRTNSRGEFIFKNVPLDTGYVVYARSAGYSFFPHPAQGTVSAITNLSIFGREV